MNANMGNLGGLFGNMGASAGGQGGGGLLSSITKMIGGNANLLPLLAGFLGNKGGAGGAGNNSLNSLSSLLGMLNNNSAANNPLGALAGLMNNNGGNDFSGINNNFNNGNSSSQMPNLDPNELLAKLSAMMNTNLGNNPSQPSPDAEEAMAEPIIDTEENSDGKYYASNNGNSSGSNNSGGFNMDNLAGLWPLFSSFMNNNGDQNNNSKPNSNERTSKQNRDTKREEKRTISKYPLDFADSESEPYSACLNCTNPCYRRQMRLPSYKEVKQMAENWSRY